MSTVTLKLIILPFYKTKIINFNIKVGKIIRMYSKHSSPPNFLYGKMDVCNHMFFYLIFFKRNPNIYKSFSKTDLPFFDCFLTKILFLKKWLNKTN